ncbi:hypothetical protein SETIT_9G363600v2 [Setaria italica]|uniref:Uncharacterized protein n=1 Tax=Setaria italica TaxID=4555 RepID=A0A368SPG6_SETIT|nr:hypothetical protein SETIT_9G363600v2 [Setaria italica]
MTETSQGCKEPMPQNSDTNCCGRVWSMWCLPEEDSGVVFVGNSWADCAATWQPSWRLLKVALLMWACGQIVQFTIFYCRCFCYHSYYSPYGTGETGNNACGAQWLCVTNSPYQFICREGSGKLHWRSRIGIFKIGRRAVQKCNGLPLATRRRQKS